MPGAACSDSGSGALKNYAAGLKYLRTAFLQPREDTSKIPVIHSSKQGAGRFTEARQPDRGAAALSGSWKSQIRTFRGTDACPNLDTRINKYSAPHAASIGARCEIQVPAKELNLIRVRTTADFSRDPGWQ